MPILFEINSNDSVLCYVPSGKTKGNKQYVQHAQDGGTCWFYSTKRLANASGVQLSSDSQAIYKVISNFRKEQSRLDGCVAIAAMLIQKNISIRDLHAKIIINLKILNIVSKYRKYILAIILSILTFISNEINLLPRQLKDEPLFRTP
jgi:hypothetical protein